MQKVKIKQEFKVRFLRLVRVEFMEDLLASKLLDLNKEYGLFVETGDEVDKVEVRGAVEHKDEAMTEIRMKLNAGASDEELTETWEKYGLWQCTVLAYRKKKESSEKSFMDDYATMLNGTPEPTTTGNKTTTGKEDEAKRLVKELKDKTTEDKPSWTVQRETLMTLARTERNLFSEIEEDAAKNAGKYVVKINKPKAVEFTINESDFVRFCFAAAQLLYNQSVKFGNTKGNTGVTQTEASSNDKPIGKYAGEIVASLPMICRLAYGTQSPNLRQRTAMKNLLEALDRTEIVIEGRSAPTKKSPKGESWRVFSKLSNILGRTEVRGCSYYYLRLHPLFCKNAKTGFAMFPQDMMERLSDKVAEAKRYVTVSHLYMIRLLGMQDKKKPFVRELGFIIEALRLESDFRHDKKRTTKRVMDICGDMVGLGILQSYATDDKENPKIFTFRLNPDYGIKALT